MKNLKQKGGLNMSNQVKRYTKLAREGTFKQSLISTPDLVLYAKTGQVTPMHTEIEYKAGYQRGQTIVGPGFYTADVVNEFAADHNILGFALNMALAGYIINPSAIDIHEFYTSKTFRLNSCQVRTGQDDHEAQTRGVGFNTLSIGVSNGELNVAISGIGSTYEKDEIDENINANSFDNLDFLTFADVEVLLDNVNISCPETKEFTININNGMTAESGQRVGSRERCLNIAGDLEVTVDFTMFRETSKFLESYLGGVSGFSETGATSHKLEFVITNPVNGDKITIILPDARIISYGYATSGNDIVDESLTFKANLGNVLAEDGITFLETLIYAALEKNLTFTLG
jgi:hypothetical protein